MTGTAVSTTWALRCGPGVYPIDAQMIVSSSLPVERLGPLQLPISGGGYFRLYPGAPLSPPGPPRHPSRRAPRSCTCTPGSSIPTAPREGAGLRLGVPSLQQSVANGPADAALGRPDGLPERELRNRTRVPRLVYGSTLGPRAPSGRSVIIPSSTHDHNMQRRLTPDRLQVGANLGSRPGRLVSRHPESSRSAAEPVCPFSFEV